MPWYYEGPESKPVGPVTLEELQARRLSGEISSETYVIEHTGQPGESLAWKRYAEIFPATSNVSSLPPVPPAPTAWPIQPPVPVPPAPGVPPAPHPLFPSAAPAPSASAPGTPPAPYPTYPPVAGIPPTPPVPPPSTTTSPHYYSGKKTNSWCLWGFILSIVSLFLAFICGIGLLFSLPALFLCIVGLAQVQKNREETGQRFAIIGLALAGMALLISLALIIAVTVRFSKEHGQTATEQTSNSSE